MSAQDRIRERIAATGRSAYGDEWAPSIESSAPGRIELIGGHLDYNGGPVLAAAIDKQIIIQAAVTGSNEIRAVFPDIDPETVHVVDPHDLLDWRIETGAGSPADFLRGVVAAMLGRGMPIRTGIDLVAAGNLPFGVGISSSAALCVALTGLLSADQLGARDLVLIAQEGENRTGSPCGTMDQSASVHGQIIRFDGATTESIQIAADLAGSLFVVANSGVVRSLATSVYPTRVRESGEALALLRDRHSGELTSLAAIPEADLPKVLALLADRPDLQSRVKHIITETSRVQDAAAAVEQRDWTAFGAIMTIGGRSSADDYGIGHPVVDELTAAALAHPAVRGARIMGGGEGGAALLLIDADGFADLSEHLSTVFYEPHGHQSSEMLIPCSIASGATVRQM